jgi:phage protein U
VIGAYGNKIFETSDRRVLTFSGFSYSSSGRYAMHEIIGAKPKPEFLGPNLGEITFEIKLRADMGLNVSKELEDWRGMVEKGVAERLIIGQKKIGRGLWTVNACSEAWSVITNKGGILSASLNISLQEYV